MNIRKVSYSIIGGLMLAGALSSCNNDTYVKKAKSQAVQYLTGDELLKAERFAREQHADDVISGKAVEYWDSLLIEAKAHEAYYKGKEAIIDSLNRKFNRKEKFKAQLDTIVEYDLCNNLKKEYAKYSNAVDFIKARDNAPSDNKLTLENELPYQIHYWNLITMTEKRKEAYHKGMADARKELKLNQ